MLNSNSKYQQKCQIKTQNQNGLLINNVDFKVVLKIKNENILRGPSLSSTSRSQ